MHKKKTGFLIGSLIISSLALGGCSNIIHNEEAVSNTESVSENRAESEEETDVVDTDIPEDTEEINVVGTDIPEEMVDESADTPEKSDGMEKKSTENPGAKDVPDELTDTPEESKNLVEESAVNPEEKFTWIIDPEVEAESISYLPDWSEYYPFEGDPYENLKSFNEHRGQMNSPYAVIDNGEQYDLIDQSGTLLTGYNIGSLSDASFNDEKINFNMKLLDEMSAFSSHLCNYVTTDGVMFSYQEGKYYERERGDRPLDDIYYSYNGTLMEYKYDDMSDVAGYVAGPYGPIGVQQSSKKTITWEDCNNNFACLDGKYAIYADGQFMTDFIYDECGSYSEGLFAVSIDGKWGYVDKYGNEVIPLEYEASWNMYLDRIHDFMTYGYCNHTNTRSYCYAATEGTVVLHNADGWALCDTSGITIIPSGYFEEITPSYNYRCWVKKDGKWGLIQLENDNDTDTDVSSEVDEAEVSIIEKGITNQPFYGIWCSASQDLSAAQAYANDLKKAGLDVEIYLSSDWSNLNSEPWYCVTAGTYSSEEDANAALKAVRNVYKDAYVKYTGSYIGNNTGDSLSSKRVNYMLASTEYIVPSEDGESFAISGNIFKEPDNKINYVVDSATKFDSSCEMEYFQNYHDGDSPLKWYQTNYDLLSAGDYRYIRALIGVFDVEVTGNHIDTIYGIYWWD